jgi:hypothetical protein
MNSCTVSPAVFGVRENRQGGGAGGELGATTAVTAVSLFSLHAQNDLCHSGPKCSQLAVSCSWIPQSNWPPQPGLTHNSGGRVGSGRTHPKVRSMLQLVAPGAADSSRGGLVQFISILGIEPVPV